MFKFLFVVSHLLTNFFSRRLRENKNTKSDDRVFLDHKI